MLNRLLAALGGVVVGWMVLHDWPLAWCLLAHGLVSVWTAFAWYGDSGPMAVRAGALALTLPVLGPVFLLLARCQPGDGSGLIASYNEYIAYDLNESRPPLLDREEGLRQEMSVQPLADDLYRGDFGGRQAAAEALALQATPPAIRQLRAALTEGDGDTRLCASLALVKSEAVFAERLAGLRESSRRPDADGRAWLDLARGLGEYADSGLPTGELATACWEESAEAAQMAKSLPSGAATALDADRLLAKAQLRLGHPEAAAEILKGLLAAGPDDPATLIAASEAWFDLGEYDRVHELAERLEGLPAGNLQQERFAQYWGDHGR
jgi:hypothetical protein